MRQLKSRNVEEGNEKKTRKKAAKTLLEHIECIVELVAGSRLSEEFYQQAKKHIQFVAKKMDLTNNQALLFAIFIEKSDDRQVLISDFSQLIGCRTVKCLNVKHN